MGLGPGAPEARWVQNWMGGSQTLAPDSCCVAVSHPLFAQWGAPEGQGLFWTLGTQQ